MSIASVYGLVLAIFFVFIGTRKTKFFGGTTTSGYRHEMKCDQPPIAVSGNIKFMAIHPDHGMIASVGNS
ncbi:hypothetical protein OROHE_017203 [Orobanche hederae]